jgi:hypothetical protein
VEVQDVHLQQVASVSAGVLPTGDAAVAEATGRTWDEWLDVLDAAGCRGMGHREIVALLERRYALSPWWQQSVTVGYERARGLRAVHQKPDGFAIGVSRTIAASPDRVFQAWTDDFVRESWLPGQPLQIRTATRRKSVRAAWRDGTRVDVSFWPRGAGRCLVQVQHEQLWSAHDVDRFRTFWKARLDGLQEICEA